MRTGEVITAEVVRVDHNFVVVNAGLKSEAYIPIEEFKNDQGEIEVKVGDFVSVAIDAIENGFGDTILSRDKAKRLASWTRLEKALENRRDRHRHHHRQGQGRLHRRWSTASAPSCRARWSTCVRSRTPSHLEGKTLEFKVIKLDRKRNNVVVSRRAVVEAIAGRRARAAAGDAAGRRRRQGRRQEHHRLRRVRGPRRHRRPAAHHRHGLAARAAIRREVVKVGDGDRPPRSSSSTPRRTASRWASSSWATIRGTASSRRYPHGTRLFGKVTNIADYGAFVEIEQGIEGLVHVSEMDWTNKNVASRPRSCSSATKSKSWCSRSTRSAAASRSA